ncbi:hypothetical protein SODALDRAFT_358190 [Sodiomyces alkalinus F11]|uniref:Uncharacterized protein n=1 Tax=Sodiomyces alkalinus (strain CBS 110278 / VKM F-3762 / F11) TaxID=1314773 RepID=A0A3N2PZ47_SODAK|nr:hypothetical protein SODALDRAFT_358190 [Sodiomyces alkalinus F11]ROT39774.1 hypothetical protein SODALDRAFT_358190 [Sodiomyces alkalinus F11]
MIDRPCFVLLCHPAFSVYVLRRQRQATTRRPTWMFEEGKLSTASNGFENRCPFQCLPQDPHTLMHAVIQQTGLAYPRGALQIPGSVHSFFNSPAQPFHQTHFHVSQLDSFPEDLALRLAIELDVFAWRLATGYFRKAHNSKQTNNKLCEQVFHCLQWAALNHVRLSYEDSLGLVPFRRRLNSFDLTWPVNCYVPIPSNTLTAINQSISVAGNHHQDGRPPPNHVALKEVHQVETPSAFQISREKDGWKIRTGHVKADSKDHTSNPKLP